MKASILELIKHSITYVPRDVHVSAPIANQLTKKKAKKLTIYLFHSNSKEIHKASEKHTTLFVKSGEIFKNKVRKAFRLIRAEVEAMSLGFSTKQPFPILGCKLNATTLNTYLSQYLG